MSMPRSPSRAVRWCATTSVVALLSAWFCVAQQAFAAPAPGARPAAAASSPGRESGVRWRTPRFVYKAEGKRLADVLQDFAASQNMAVIVGEGVEGVVKASFDSTADDFLSAVSKAYGLIWYYDGAAIYFYPSRAIQSRIFRVKGYSGDQVDELLRSLQLSDRRYPLRYNRAQQTLLVYGPPRHVELVAAAIESLDAGVGEHDQPVTRVFSLRFASAGDRKIGSQSVPGVVSVLRGLYRSYGAGSGEDVQQQSAASGEAFVKKAATITQMYGMDRLSPHLPTPSGSPSGSSADKSLTGGGPRGVRSPVDDRDAPTFQADEATNAVLVRGKRSRMAEYGDLIRRLDIKPTLIELEAMIIDVGSDSIDSLGIAWSVKGAHGSFAVAPPGSGGADPGSLRNGSGAFAITTLWQNAGRELLARVSALEAQGKARVVAKPRVLGVVNRPALMQEKRIANVRVAGNLEANLYQVEAGTELQVTPQITTFDTQCRIKLSIYIVDGKFEEAIVDQVPVVKHTEIRTEAHMTEGESLLIGGISVESESSHSKGVPGLQRVPVVGGLFRWKDSTKSRSERLFLITPRVVREQVVGNVAPGAAAQAEGTEQAADVPQPMPQSQQQPRNDALWRD